MEGASSASRELLIIQGQAARGARPGDIGMGYCNAMELPMPPEEMRALVGPTDPAAFDNPSGESIFPFDASLGDVLDFGCGCGRLARQFIQQDRQPRSYLGIDLHAGMVRWCDANLTKAAPQFRFVHHDIYNVGFNPGPDKPAHLPLPAEDESRDFLIAHSVFTHIIESSVMHYLSECARVVRPGGILATTWFLFDKRGFPMMQSFQNALYINVGDPTNAVIYDREWLRRACLTVGLELREWKLPDIRGYHWVLYFQRTNAPKPLELPVDSAPFGSMPPPVVDFDPAGVG